MRRRANDSDERAGDRYYQQQQDRRHRRRRRSVSSDDSGSDDYRPRKRLAGRRVDPPSYNSSSSDDDRHHHHHHHRHRRHDSDRRERGRNERHSERRTTRRDVGSSTTAGHSSSRWSEEDGGQRGLHLNNVTSNSNTAAVLPDKLLIVSLSGVDLSVSPAHLTSITEQLAGVKPRFIRRPAQEELLRRSGAFLKAYGYTERLRADGRVVSEETAHSIQKLEMFFHEAFQAMHLNSAGGVVLCQFEDTTAASRCCESLHGADINGRRVSASLVLDPLLDQ